MNKSKIGFLGDGQLAKMSAEAALELGFNARFLGKNPTESCAGLGEFVQGDIFNAQDVEAFAKTCDFVTLENEFIPTPVLESCGDKLAPALSSFKKIENKIIEKQTAKELGLPIGAYKVYSDLDSVEFVAPSMLKLAKGGYDGYGNWFLNSHDDLQKLKAKNLEGAFLLEELIPFEREVAITLARSHNGEMAFYPVVDTIQENNKCSRVLAPSTLPAPIQKEVEELSRKFASGMEYVGVMSLEFFVLENGKIYFNECSPRPHNSGHYTMDACQSSQFENHIRAIAGMPLASTAMLFPQALML
ncbi:MAG: ATP-grasp domain-containing protein, partial [Bacteriovoracaceae bacterium]